MDTTSAIDLTSARLRADLRALVRDTEALLGAAAHDADERLAPVRARAQHALDNARDLLHGTTDELLTRARVTGRLTDQYVQGHPWTAVGTAATVAFLLGYLIGRR
jgi:ElaB/YqjD/DUF883 family membrane-anchored ribosome-binding protein